MKRLALVVVAVAGLSAPARANVEVGGTGGLHVFSDSNALGDSPTQDTLKNSSFFGFRVGAFFGPKLGAEIEGGFIESEPRGILFDVWSIGARAQVAYQLFADRPAQQWIPFAFAGAGVTSVVKSNDEQNFKKDSVFAPHLGVGAKYRTGNGWGVRGDARLILPPKQGNMPGTKSGVTTDFEILLALYREFGQKKIVKKAVEVKPQPAADPDKDGITGAADKCPNEAEDKDGFQDDDGCPDLDNDGDGIADAKDKCPMEAEDKDGFQDDDGCPDPDNDGDGVPDAADKCSDKPETKNGFEDGDGCPDEIPDKLKATLGVIATIQFKPNTADLAPASNKALDALAAAMVEAKDVKVAIAVHTDDQPPPKGGKFADNMALSQARADAVKAYLVTKGIEDARLDAKGHGDAEPVEAPAGLTGAKLAAARNKNRRVELTLVIEGAAPAATPTPTPPSPPPPAPAPPAPTPAPAPVQPAPTQTPAQPAPKPTVPAPAPAPAPPKK
jgi:OmpA-OmpF porin, OOP family